MFSIGDFARIGGVSVRTLRYYEEAGLLAPAAVAQTTGYRSYSAHQLLRLHRIVALKDLGLSLRQLAPLLDELSAEQLRGMLLLKRAQLRERLAEEQLRLDRVESRLRHIESEDQMPVDIVLKELPAFRAAVIRCAEPDLDFSTMAPVVEPAFAELRKRLNAADVRIAGPLFLFYEPVSEDTVIPNVAVDIGDQSAPVDDLIAEITLPAITAATTLYRGEPGHDAIGPLYVQLARWAEAHGYSIDGPGRDLFIGPLEEGSSEFVSEHQLPITKI
jgi:DNA-binding transcriptional MerR regulator